jgi:hypothetical protein
MSWCRSLLCCCLVITWNWPWNVTACLGVTPYWAKIQFGAFRGPGGGPVTRRWALRSGRFERICWNTPGETTVVCLVVLPHSRSVMNRSTAPDARNSPP